MRGTVAGERTAAERSGINALGPSTPAEDVCLRLPVLECPAKSPARLIAPAAQGGHREADRADRLGQHQLFPLLVHAVLFGRSYSEQVLQTARAALAP